MLMGQDSNICSLESNASRRRVVSWILLASQRTSKYSKGWKSGFKCWWGSVLVQPSKAPFFNAIFALAVFIFFRLFICLQLAKNLPFLRVEIFECSLPPIMLHLRPRNRKPRPQPMAIKCWNGNCPYSQRFSKSCLPPILFYLLLLLLF